MSNGKRNPKWGLLAEYPEFCSACGEPATGLGVCDEHAPSNEAYYTAKYGPPEWSIGEE